MATAASSVNREIRNALTIDVEDYHSIVGAGGSASRRRSPRPASSGIPSFSWTFWPPPASRPRSLSWAKWRNFIPTLSGGLTVRAMNSAFTGINTFGFIPSRRRSFSPRWTGRRN